VVEVLGRNGLAPQSAKKSPEQSQSFSNMAPTVANEPLASSISLSLDAGGTALIGGLGWLLRPAGRKAVGALFRARARTPVGTEFLFPNAFPKR
jgi:hypothetical protein